MCDVRVCDYMISVEVIQIRVNTISIVNVGSV